MELKIPKCQRSTRCHLFASIQLKEKNGSRLALSERDWEIQCVTITKDFYADTQTNWTSMALAVCARVNERRGDPIFSFISSFGRMQNYKWPYEIKHYYNGASKFHTCTDWQTDKAQKKKKLKRNEMKTEIHWMWLLICVCLLSLSVVVGLAAAIRNCY